jgi:hypothetical protein
LVGEIARKGQLRRCRRRWKDNIKIDLKEKLRDLGIDLPGFAYGPVACSCEQFIKSLGCIKCWEYE